MLVFLSLGVCYIYLGIYIKNIIIIINMCSSLFQLPQNTFYYNPQSNYDDAESDEEGTLAFKLKKHLAAKRSNNIDCFFETPKKKTKIQKQSSLVAQGAKDGVSYLTSGENDATKATHLVKVEIYDMVNIRNVPSTDHWKHADVRVKYYTQCQEDKYLDSAKDIIYNITKHVAAAPECVKYYIPHKNQH